MINTVNLMTGNRVLLRKLDKAARRKLTAARVEQPDLFCCVFGVSRNKLGQLSTFFRCMSYEELQAFDEEVLAGNPRGRTFAVYHK